VRATALGRSEGVGGGRQRLRLERRCWVLRVSWHPSTLVAYGRTTWERGNIGEGWHEPKRGECVQDRSDTEGKPRELELWPQGHDIGDIFRELFFIFLMWYTYN